MDAKNAQPVKSAIKKVNFPKGNKSKNLEEPQDAVESQQELDRQEPVENPPQLDDPQQDTQESHDIYSDEDNGSSDQSSDQAVPEPPQEDHSEKKDGPKQICHFFLRGECNYGKRCRHIHAGKSPVGGEYKTVPCHHDMKGGCLLGDRCNFLHQSDLIKAALRAGIKSAAGEYKKIPCRNDMQGQCDYGDKCRFLHKSDLLKSAQCDSAMPRRGREPVREDVKTFDALKASKTACCPSGQQCPLFKQHKDNCPWHHGELINQMCPHGAKSCKRANLSPDKGKCAFKHHGDPAKEWIREPKRQLMDGRQRTRSVAPRKPMQSNPRLRSMSRIRH